MNAHSSSRRGFMVGLASLFATILFPGRSQAAGARGEAEAEKGMSAAVARGEAGDEFPGGEALGGSVSFTYDAASRLVAVECGD